MFRTYFSISFGDWPPEIQEAIAFLVPKPSPFTLERFGGKKDGAYLLPPELLDNTVACFSPGVANSKRFEDDLANRRHIRSHLLDASSDLEKLLTPLIPGIQTFEKKWLSAKSSGTERTLTEWVELHEPRVTGDLLLQMDIEGSEWEILKSTPTETLQKFGTIVIELHGLDTIFGNLEVFRTKAQDVFSKLKESFTVVHAHPNNCCGSSPRLYGGRMRIPRTLELTLIRTNILEDYGSSFSFKNPLLPHPLDIWRNDPSKPPIFLGDGWRWRRVPARSLGDIALQKCWYELAWRWKRSVPRSIYFRYRDMRRRLFGYFSSAPS